MAVKKRSGRGAKRRKRKPKAAPVAEVIPPKPELLPRHRRFFAVVNKKNAIGLWLISIGSAFCLGYLLTDRAHLHEKVVLVIGGMMILFGAHFLSSEGTERALVASGRFIARVMHGGRNGNGHTAERKADGDTNVRRDA